MAKGDKPVPIDAVGAKNIQEFPPVDPARMQYTALAGKFGSTHRRQGNNFDYLTGFQVVDRLNAVLGFDCWQFEIVEHGISGDAGEIWVLGRLTAWSASGRKVNREQFGSQKINKRRTDGLILDIGFDLKGASTDALKKCASLIGVGLYLSAKDDDQPTLTGSDPPVDQAPGIATNSQPPTQPQTPARTLTCELCTREIRSVTLPDKTKLTADQFAKRGQELFDQVLCVEHFSIARKAQVEKAAAAAQAEAWDVGGDEPSDVSQAPQKPAQAKSEPTGEDVAKRPLMVNGRVDLKVAAARYGAKVAGLLGRGYKAPSEAAKKGLYTSLGKNLSWKREDLYRLLGLNPTNQHLEAWMELAQVDSTALYNLAFLRHQDEDVRVPTYADLTHGAAS